MENDDVIEEAAALVRRFEGFSARPYICPAGYPTIGYGTLVKSLDTPPITREVAERIMQDDLRKKLVSVDRQCPGLIDRPYTRAAILDFVYNLGAGRLQASTLRRRINQGDWDAAEYELNRWTRGGGRVLRGLVIRRTAETQLMRKDA